MENQQSLWAACSGLHDSRCEGLFSFTWQKMSSIQPVTVVSWPFPLHFWEEHGCCVFSTIPCRQRKAAAILRCSLAVSSPGWRNPLRQLLIPHHKLQPSNSLRGPSLTFAIWLSRDRSRARILSKLKLLLNCSKSSKNLSNSPSQIEFLQLSYLKQCWKSCSETFVGFAKINSSINHWLIKIWLRLWLLVCTWI